MRYKKQNKNFYVAFTVLFLSCVLSKGVIYAEKPMTWAGLKNSIQNDFPGIPYISTQQLSDYLLNRDTVQPVLIDARTPKEYAVSHLKDAHNADTKQAALKILENLNKDTFVVVYCSVGYRSAALVKDLMTQGYTNVYNLEGSIFEWANDGRPVYNNKNEEVKSVHPYDKKWGALLEKELWSPMKKK